MSTTSRRIVFAKAAMITPLMSGLCRGKIPHIGADEPSGVQDDEIVLRELLFQIQNRLQRNAVASLRTSVDDKNIHNSFPPWKLSLQIFRPFFPDSTCRKMFFYL